MKNTKKYKILLTKSMLKNLYLEIRDVPKTAGTIPNFEKNLLRDCSNVKKVDNVIVVTFDGDEYLLWDYIADAFH